MENRILGQFRTSASFYSTQSGLNTALGGEDQVRRSRIEHLPSYQRRDLSGKLDFVVVFQTLEIERLSTEIEALRVMLRDAERQIRNSLSYQVQIRELTENCHLLEQQQAEYQHQVEQMSLACNALYGELADAQKLREREAEVNSSETAQLSANNQQLTQKTSALEEQLRRSKDSEKQLEKRAKAAAQEVARLTQNVADSQEKAIKKGKQFARLQQELKNWQETDRQQRERTVNVLREQKRQLAEQVARLRAQSGIISTIKRDLEGSKRENDFLKQQMDSIKDQFSRLRNQNKSNLTALNQSQLTNQQLTRQFKMVGSDMAKEKERAQQIADFASELKVKIEAKIKDLEAVKRTVGNYEKELQSRNERQAEILKRVEAVGSILVQNNNLQEQIMRLNNKLVETQGEKNAKAQQLIDMALDNKELQSRIRQLQVACQRSQSELQLLQGKLQKNRQQMEGEKRRLTNEYQRLLQKEGEEKNRLNNQVKQLEKDLLIVKQEGLVKQQLRNQIKVLAENIKRQDATIQSMLTRIQSYQGNFKKLKDKYAQMNEIAKANTIIRQQLEASFALNDRMIQKIGSYQQQIEALTDQNWRLSDRIREEYNKDDFSTASSTKTATSLKYSNVQQVKPFDTLPERPFFALQGRSFIEGIRTKDSLGSSIVKQNSYGTLSSGWRR